jgi:hypothetical protein
VLYTFLVAICSSEHSMKQTIHLYISNFTHNKLAISRGGCGVEDHCIHHPVYEACSYKSPSVALLVNMANQTGFIGTTITYNIHGKSVTVYSRNPRGPVRAKNGELSSSMCHILNRTQHILYIYLICLY